MHPDHPKSSYLQEIERRANDLLRVFNPLEEDYVVVWDRRGGEKLFRVPAKSEEVLIRYIAEKYIKEMYEKILNDKAHDAIVAENERRVSKGMAEMDKTQRTGEQMQFEAKFYSPSDEEAKKIISILYVGLEREYGVDKGYRPGQTKTDDRPAFTKALESVSQDKGYTGENATQKVSVEATEGLLKCDWPGCDYTTEHKIALFQHKKTHRAEMGDLEVKKAEAVSKISK
jgi:hypothetical protein